MATTWHDDPGLRSNLRRAALVSLAVVVLAGVVVALVRADLGGRSDDAATSASFDEAESAATAEGQVAATADAGSGGAQGAAPSPSSVPSAPTAVVRTATLRLRVPGEFGAAVERVTDLAIAAGGFVSTSSASSYEEGRGSGELTLRVPADRFDQVRRQVAELGTLEASEIGGREVGGELVDLDARLRSLRAEETALGELLGASRDIGQILQVRDRLTGVRTQIEQLAGQQAALQDQVALATITVAMHQDESGATAAASASDDDPLLVESFRTAGGALLAVVGGMAIVGAALAPFALLALVGLLVWRAVSARRRRYGAPHAEAR